MSLCRAALAFLRCIVRQAGVAHPTPADYQAASERVAGAVADYWRRLRDEPSSLSVRSRVVPGAVYAGLGQPLPEHGKPLHGVVDDLLREVREVIEPGLTHWQHPSFFAYFPANATFPAMLGDQLASGLGVQGMLWATSPACTEVETRVLDALGEALALPGRFLSHTAHETRGGGVIQGTASEGVLAALVAARWRVRDARRRAGDVSRPHLTIYTSEQAHSSVIKACMVAGLADDAEDRTHVRLIGTDDQLRMRPDLLAHALEEDVRAGRVPCMVVATIGTTGTTAIDSLDAIARVVRDREGQTGKPQVWIHVDAAHAGAACVCPEYQHWLKGIDLCDSFCMNPHKWLLTNFDCDCFWTSDRHSLTRSMSISPAYLRTSASEDERVIDYRDWHVPLGRRFRSLKLLMVMRHYGLEGLRAFVRSHIEMAREFEDWARASTRWRVVAPRTMNLVCIALARDEETRRVMEAINASGRAMLSHAIVPGPNGPRHAIRVCVGGVLTMRDDVRVLWEILESEAAAEEQNR